MTMHLEGPALTTTSYKKRTEKITKAKQAELEQGWRERNQRLKEMGLPKETLEQYTDWVYGRGKKTKEKKVSRLQSSKTYAPLHKNTSSNGKPNLVVESNSGHARLETSDKIVQTEKPNSLGLWITGAVASKQAPVYTGTKILGIGTMHKSNAVPIFSDDEAKDISSMRR